MTDPAWTVRPLLPLRDVVLFPGMTVPLFVGRPGSMAAALSARSGDGTLLAVTQRRAETDSPGPADLFTVGVLVRIIEYLDLPDGTMKILVAPFQRAAVGDVLLGEPRPSASCRPLGDTAADGPASERLARAVVAAFAAHVRVNGAIHPEIVSRARATLELGALADLVTPHLDVPVAEKQGVLEAVAVNERLRLCLAAIGRARSSHPRADPPDLE